ncbi:hypothetical protein MKW92_031957, partial [Papaver armeniacum]
MDDPEQRKVMYDNLFDEKRVVDLHHRIVDIQTLLENLVTAATTFQVSVEVPPSYRSLQRYLSIDV